MDEEHRKLKPEELLEAKDRVLKHWRSLPPEHQATLLLVLFQEVMGRDMAGWAINALFTLYLQNEERGKRVLPLVSHAHLKRLNITNEELASLTDDDLATIAQRMQGHYEQDWFWAELEFHTEQVLQEKREQNHTDFQ